MELEEKEFAEKLSASRAGLAIVQKLGLKGAFRTPTKEDLRGLKGVRIMLRSEEELFAHFGEGTTVRNVLGDVRQEEGARCPNHNAFRATWARIQKYCGQEVILYDVMNDEQAAPIYIDLPDGYEVSPKFPLEAFKIPQGGLSDGS